MHADFCDRLRVLLVLLVEEWIILSWKDYRHLLVAIDLTFQLIFSLVSFAITGLLLHLYVVLVVDAMQRLDRILIDLHIFLLLAILLD